MATYVRDYELTLYQSVAIEAESKEDAERIFAQLENGPKRWYYLNSEVYERMGEYMMNEYRYIVNDDIKPVGEVYEDEDYIPMDQDYLAGYIGEE